MADICIGHLQFTVFSHLFTSQFCKECDQGLPFPLLTAGGIEWCPLRTQNISGRTRTGPSFLDSRFSARAFSGWGLFPLKFQCNRKFDWCCLAARFQKWEVRVVVGKESQSSNQSRHHIFIMIEARRRCTSAKWRRGRKHQNSSQKELRVSCCREGWAWGGWEGRGWVHTTGGRTQPGTSPEPAG